MNGPSASTIEAIWTQFEEPLHRYIGRHVNDEQAAADLLQDVFVKIHRGIDTLNDAARLEGWLYRIARNTVYDFYRTTHPQSTLSDDLPAVVEGEDDGELQERLAQSVRWMAASLPPEYALALHLTEFEGLSQQQLAEELGLSLSGAKSRVQRARKMLRAALLACCEFEFDRRGRVIDYWPRRCACQTECAC